MYSQILNCMATDHVHPHHDRDHDLDTDRGHDHGNSALSRLRHLLGDVFGTHSHDSADKVDQAMEADANGRRALITSLVIMLGTAALQAFVVMLSGSVALLGDTLHNFADALTAVPLLIAFRLALRPATKRFTYGYGRAEDLAGIFVVAMIALSSALAAWQAIDRLLNPRTITHLWIVAIAAVIGFAGNEIVAGYRIRVGRRIGSAALVADGLHARTDGLTSLAVLFGVIGTALGWKQADPVVGLVITVAILGVLRSALRQVGARLMDAVDPGLVDQAQAALLEVPGVQSVADLKLRWIGHSLRAEAALRVNPTLSVTAGHRLAHLAESQLQAHIPRLSAASVHIGPAEPDGQS
jgi:cation diffusion facilitator family transporter